MWCHDCELKGEGSFQMNLPMSWCWKSVQRRVSDKVSFERKWSEYKEGFGDRRENFWLGELVPPVSHIPKRAVSIILEVFSSLFCEWERETTVFGSYFCFILFSSILSATHEQIIYVNTLGLLNFCNFCFFRNRMHAQKVTWIHEIKQQASALTL